VTHLRIFDIDVARANPASFRRNLSAPPTRTGFGASYFSSLRDALFRYHRSNGDLGDASAYLERRLGRFKNTHLRERFMDHLFWYVEEYEALGWPTFRTRQRLIIPLPRAKSNASTCSGEISRLDVIPSSGYAAWFFRRQADPDWAGNLYPPLVQDSVARNVLHTRPEFVTVGAYLFDARQVVSKTYTDGELRAAKAKLGTLVSSLGL